MGYDRYVYRFFGIGNETRVEDEEFYDVHFPRVRLNLLKRLAPRHYLGLRYWWDDYRIVRTGAGGLLDTGEITGSNGGGGVLSGAGTVAPDLSTGSTGKIIFFMTVQVQSLKAPSDQTSCPPSTFFLTSFL